MNISEYALVIVMEEVGEMIERAFELESAADNIAEKNEFAISFVNEANDVIGAIVLLSQFVELSGLLATEQGITNIVSQTDNVKVLTIIRTASSLHRLTSKALRFGLDDRYPNSPNTNRQEIVRHSNELLGLIKSYCMINGLARFGERGAIQAKVDKITLWMEHSINNDILECMDNNETIISSLTP